jgi:hypothetical protein
MKELFDLNSLGIEMQQTCVTVTTKYLRERRPVVKSFLQGYAEGLHRFMTDREFSIQVMKKVLAFGGQGTIGRRLCLLFRKTRKNPVPDNQGHKVYFGWHGGNTSAGEENRTGEFC